MFVHSGEALGQAASPHAGELSVGEQRGGFTGYRLCRRPLLDSMTRLLDDMMSAECLMASWAGSLLGWAGLARVLSNLVVRLWPLKKHCRHQPGDLDSCRLGACRLLGSAGAGSLLGWGWQAGLARML